jgi:hypothetical protein
VYVGLSFEPVARIKAHARNALKSPGPEYAVAFAQPSEAFLALHGDPTLVALVACPTRRHAHLYEAILTAQLGNAGVHVYGAGFDRMAPKWARNEVKGRKLLAAPEQLLAAL